MLITIPDTMLSIVVTQKSKLKHKVFVAYKYSGVQNKVAAELTDFLKPYL